VPLGCWSSNAWSSSAISRRRLWRVNSEALLIGAGLNLKRLLTHWGWWRRPFPSEAAQAVQQPDNALLFPVLVVLLEGIA
jgi:hypothetical protein